MSESDQNTASSINNENAKRILTLLKQGEDKINLGTHHDVVLVLGNTGSGKSTFTHFIAGNNDDLFSTEVGEDSGEFIISDTNNKINFNTTVLSKTAHPELWVDTDTKTAFVDCPGFNSHNEAYDIATSYFIKKVLDKAQNVKIVLIVSYPSLRKGVNGNDFLQLLQHVTILIKNIEKYIDSVALVATKVDNTFIMRQGVPIMVPDRTIIEQIAKFLQEVKASLKIVQNNEPYTPEFQRVQHKVFYENAAKLLDGLLSKKDTKYSKIGIFRRPNEAGKISQQELLQNGKKVLKTMLEKNLKYLPINKADIGYSVTDKSKTVIRELMNEINGNVIDDFTLIAQNLIEYYTELEGKMLNDDMYALRDRLEQASAGLKQITGIDKSASIDELVNSMCENFTQMAVQIPKSYIRDIKNLAKFVTFLQEISGQKLELLASKCTKELESVVNAVDNSLKWYNLLATLHNRLSEYDIQKNTTVFKVPQLETKNEVFLIDTFNDFHTFIDEIGDSNLLKSMIHEDSKGIHLDATKFQYFDRLINVTLKTPLTIACVDDSKRLQVVGEYVKLSQIMENECYLNSASVQILAKHTIFIDTDLSKENDISIIAPRWHIIGSRKISLDGTNGQSHSIPKANDGSWEGSNGEDGLPGKPGTSGGHFFGIGHIFENSKKLTISANGGNGGIGQHGGDGKIGARGKDASKMEEIFPPSRVYNQKDLLCNVNQSCVTTFTYYNNYEYRNVMLTVRGSPGSQGGNAGYGGAGGTGGEAGTVTLIGSNDIFTSVLGGLPGPFGLHGSCAPGGDGGREISINYGDRYYISSYATWQLTSNRADKGDSGTCLHVSWAGNANHRGLQESQKKDFYSPSLTISNFMIHLINNFNNCITKKTSKKIFNQMLNNDQLKKLYNLEFVMNSLELQKNYNQFALDTNTMFNQFLLTTTIEATKTLSENQIEERQKSEMINILLTSKLIRLYSRPENRLPLNYNEYFNLVGADMNTVEHYHLNAITKKIADTVELMETLIVPQMTDDMGRIDIEIAKLSQNDVIGDELDSLLLKRKLFSCLKSFADFSSLALSLANADLTISNGTKISEFSPTLTFQVSTLPADSETFLKVKRDINEFEFEIDREIDAVTWVISNELATLQVTGDEYEEFCKRMRGIKAELRTFALTKAKTSTIRDIINNAILHFDEVNLGLIKLAPNNSNLDKIIKRYQNHMKLIQFDAKMYRNIKSECNIERLINAVDRTNDNISRLNNAMKAFFDVGIPILKTVHASFTNTGYKPNDTQLVRQLVQEGLEKLKVIAYRMTEQSEMDEDLLSLSENLDEVFTALTNIYGSLNNHENRTRFNAIFRYVDEHNETQKILPSITSEYLLYGYERSIDVFKRYTFPYYTLYPSNFTVPSLPNFDQNLKNLKSAIATNVKSLQSNLEAMRQSNEYLLQDYFNNTSSFGAFFVWKSEVYGKTIKRFLRGQEIALRATINENDSHEMIKFDSINLAFRSSNDTTQQLLNDIRMNFSLRMTHSGNSYFKFCNQTHIIYSDSIALSYNLNETSVQMEPILSPYTTWIVKLAPIDANASFSILEPFRQQQIDLILEGHAKYINAQNQSICEKFLTGPITTNYTSLMTNNTKKIIPIEGTSNSTRKRRDVSSQWSGFTPSFKDNFSFLKSFNPFSLFVGTNSQNEPPTNPKSLEWRTESSTSTSTVQPSSDLNSTLFFLDYLVRNVTKLKPYHAKTATNLDQVRIVTLEIMDRFEAMLSKLGDELDIPSSQLEFDPVKLMVRLEREIINGDPSAITKVLRNSVLLDFQFENHFDAELAHMLDQMNHHSIETSRVYQSSDAGQFHIEQPISDYISTEPSSTIGNYNTSILN